MGDIILNKFFIGVGGLFLAVVRFFKNFSFKRVDKKGGQDSPIFSKSGTGNEMSKEEKFEIHRQNIIYYMGNKYVILLLAVVAIFISFLGLELSAIFLVFVAMVYFYILNYPKIQVQRNVYSLNQELPYALRHISIELKSGKGLHDSLITIKNSNYGFLSNEFSRVLEEIKYGQSTEESLLEMADRINSEGLSRCVQQIVGTLRVGGNLAYNLEVIAKDITFDMHIKLKEYSQKLNSFILIYTFLAILIPVITLIMLMAASTVMGDILSSSIILMIYSVFFPMIVLFMGVFMKKLEPKI